MNLSIFNASQNTRNRLGNIDMSVQGTYNYTITWNGEHIFNFQPANVKGDFRMQIYVS